MTQCSSIGGDFYDKYTLGWEDTSEVMNDWEDVFTKVCVRWFGMNDYSAKFLFDEMCEGNWKHLHQTEDERGYTASKWFEEFVCDVFYCCNRWSIDRLMRTHWRYRQWLDAVDKKNIESLMY